jgi:hypothetical protein
MNIAASGLSSGNKIATYHENRTQRKTDLTFYSKGQLKNHIEILEMELEAKIKELETRNHFLENENHEQRVELIGYRMKIINEYKEDKGAFMHVAS